ncbi:MAG: hypothetical protein KME08_14480 [Aphanothece sp. CMT-3BRIN-NPC111]|jgi:serine/threonine protein kinase|nr:hypothetical protein [Aphanothece sp. CMT-3BRIN-NPC111]
MLDEGRISAVLRRGVVKSYCLKPGCQNPQTADRWQFCLSCGSKLLLKERYRPIQPLARGGKAFPPSDLYSLGVTCIRLLTNVPPLNMYDIDEHQWWWCHHLPKGRSVSDRLGQILDKLLQHSITQRYSCADEVLPANNITP